MKRSKLKDLLFLSAMLAVVFGTISSAPAGLVARYGFEGNADDLSGNGLNGQLKAGAAIIADAERGSVLSLDGAGAYVDLGNPAAYNLTNKITISLWIKVKKFDRPHQTIISKGDTGWRLARSLKNTDALEFGCGYWEDYPAVYGEISVNDGKWHHIACVNNGIVQYLYVDGQLDAFWPVTASPAIQTNSFPVLIGENAEYRERSFNGLIDDVVILDYALTAEQIQQLYSQNLGDFLTTATESTNDGLSVDDKSLWLQTRTAVSNIQLKDFDAAQTVREELQADFSSHNHIAIAAISIADAYRSLKDPNQALALYQYALSKQPPDKYKMRIIFETALLNIQLKYYTAADAAIQQIISQFSSHKQTPFAVYETALLFAGAGKTEKARQLHQYNATNFSADKFSMWSQVELINADIANKNNAAAQAGIDNLLAKYSGNKGIAKEVCQIAMRYAGSGDQVKAQELYQYVISHWPQDNYTLSALKEQALLSIQLKDLVTADTATEGLFSRFAEHDQVQQALYQIALRYAGTGNQDKARLLHQRNADNFTGKHALWSQVEAIMLHVTSEDDLAAQAGVENLLHRYAQNEGLANEIHKVAMHFAAKGNTAKALELFQHNIDNFSGDKCALWSQAEAIKLYVNNKNEVAVQAGVENLLNNYASIEGVAHEIHKVAMHFAAQDNTDKARELFQHNIDNNSEDKYSMWSLVELTDICLKQNDTTSAQACVDKLLNQYSDRDNIAREVHNVARRFSKNKDYEKARQLYQHVLSHWPQDKYAMYAHLSQAKDHVKLQDYTAADASIDKIFTDYTHQEDFFDVVYWAAEQYYNKALFEPQEPQKLSPREYLQKTLAIMERLTSLPAEPKAQLDIVAIESLQMMGYCYQRQGQYEKGINCYEKLLTDWPDYEHNSNIQYNIGMMYEKLRDEGGPDPLEAGRRLIEAYNKVLQDYPDTPAAQAAAIRLKNLSNRRKP